MKHLLIIAFLIRLTTGFAQPIATIERHLDSAFAKIHYWHSMKSTDLGKLNPYDSLEQANADFERLLLQYTSSNSQTIGSAFQWLVENGLTIATAEDGLFRIYSWDSRTGGSMRVFRNLFQFRDGAQVYSKTNGRPIGEGLNAGCYYDHISSVVAAGKKYYLTQSRAILSSGLSYHKVKVFSIEQGHLNDTAKLIRTGTGIRNELGYEVDLTAKANMGRAVPGFSIGYDRIKKIISIPVILANGKVTTARIRYQLKNRYFEKL